MASDFAFTATNGGEKSDVVFADAPGAENVAAGEVLVKIDAEGMTKSDALNQLEHVKSRIVDMDWPADE